MIADRIKELREKNGYTQAFVARKIGVTRSAVNAWEMGINIPTAQYIIELANLFKVTTDYVLDVDRQELVDFGFLAEEEKRAIYSLLDCCYKYRKYDALREEYLSLKSQRVQLPDRLEELFEELIEPAAKE